MMPSPLVFYLTCLLWAHTTALNLSPTIHQDRSFVSLETGNSLTLPCFYEDNLPASLYWYKQPMGQKPQLISSFYKFEKNGTLYGEFKNNQRFTLDTRDGNSHLKISDLRISDSAVYNCITSYLSTLDILESTAVSVTGSASVLQSASEIIQPGSSVTLNCTVHTGTCDGEYSVYWFKQPQESHPGLIYTHGGRNDQCERKDNTQTHTCVYNLRIKSLNLSHAGTYYCAVASCGHMLFGDGTKLDFQDKVDSSILVYFLGGALTFTTILVVFLALSVFKMNKRNRYQSTESQARLSAPPTTNAEGHGDARNLHYAALNVKLPNRSRRQRNNTSNECVYSSVKL